MVEALQDCLVTVVLWKIQIGSPPGVRWRGGAVRVQERVEIRFIERSVRPDVVQRPGAGLHVVNVPVRETAFVEKAAVLFLYHEIQTPEIAAELVGGRRLVQLVDDAKLNVSGQRRMHAAQAE